MVSKLGSVRKLPGFGVVASTLVPVVRIVYCRVLKFLYEMPSVVVLPNVLVFTLEPGLLRLTLGVVRVRPVSVAVLVVLPVLQVLQQMRWKAGIMQYCWSIAILHNMERSVRHREPRTKQ